MSRHLIPSPRPYMRSSHSNSRRKGPARAFVTKRARSQEWEGWWREKVQRGMKTGIRLVCEGRHSRGGVASVWSLRGGEARDCALPWPCGYPFLLRKEGQGETSPTRQQNRATNPVRTNPRSRLTDAATPYVTLIADALQRNDSTLLLLSFPILGAPLFSHNSSHLGLIKKGR